MFGVTHKELRVMDPNKGDLELLDGDIIVLLGGFTNLSKFGR